MQRSYFVLFHSCKGAIIYQAFLSLSGNLIFPFSILDANITYCEYFYLRCTSTSRMNIYCLQAKLLAVATYQVPVVVVLHALCEYLFKARLETLCKAGCAVHYF